MSEIAASLRPLTEEDLHSVLQIETQSHLAPWTELHFRAEMEKSHSRVWVLTDDETDSQILGYIVFWVLFGEVQILDIVVPEAHRRSGFAQRMIQAAIREGLQGQAKKMLLDVRKSNLPAIQLYQKMGFTITQVRKSFYSNGEDAYQMQLDLEPTGASALKF